MEQLKRQNLSEIIAGRIKHYIIDNQLKPGDRLPTEHQMAERFGVSRVSIREATKALGFLGILRSAPRRGLTVGEVDMRRVTEYLGFHLVLTDYPKRQLLETRIIIETGALPHVAERMLLEAALYDRLSAMTEQLREAHDLEQRIAGDIAFHRALLDASGVGPLVAFNDLLDIFFSRFRQSVEQAAWDDGVRGHQQILDASARRRRRGCPRRAQHTPGLSQGSLVNADRVGTGTRRRPIDGSEFSPAVLAKSVDRRSRQTEFPRRHFVALQSPEIRTPGSTTLIV